MVGMPTVCGVPFGVNACTVRCGMLHGAVVLGLSLGAVVDDEHLASLAVKPQAERLAILHDDAQRLFVGHTPSVFCAIAECIPDAVLAFHQGDPFRR